MERIEFGNKNQKKTLRVYLEMIFGDGTGEQASTAFIER